MPSFSKTLEETLHRAIAYANQRKHEYATLEHLLLSLLDDSEATAVMKACNVDLPALKKSLGDAGNDNDGGEERPKRAAAKKPAATKAKAPPKKEPAAPAKKAAAGGRKR